MPSQRRVPSLKKERLEDEQLNQQDWQDAIFASALSPSARLVALTMGTFGSWKQDSTVYPGMTRLSEMCNMDRKTVKKHRQEVIDAGYLKDTGRRAKNNTTIFELTCPEVVQTREVRKMNPASLENLKKAPVHVVAESIHNLMDKQKQHRNRLVVEGIHNLDTQPNTPEEVGCGNSDQQVVETSTLGCGKYPQEHTYNLKENISTSNKLLVQAEDVEAKEDEEVEASTAPAGPVDSSTSLSIFKVEEFESLVEQHEEVRGMPFPSHTKDKAREYFLDSTWLRKITGIDREIEAMKQASRDVTYDNNGEW